MAFIIVAALALLLVELFLRRRPWAMALAAAIAAIGTVVWIFSDYQSRSQRSAASSVTVTVEGNGTTCVDPDLPIAATLTNDSTRGVNRLAFDLFGREPGRSKILYRGTLRHDRPLAPGETVVAISAELRPELCRYRRRSACGATRCSIMALPIPARRSSMRRNTSGRPMSRLSASDRLRRSDPKTAASFFSQR